MDSACGNSLDGVQVVSTANCSTKVLTEKSSPLLILADRRWGAFLLCQSLIALGCDYFKGAILILFSYCDHNRILV